MGTSTTRRRETTRPSVRPWRSAPTSSGVRTGGADRQRNSRVSRRCALDNVALAAARRSDRAATIRPWFCTGRPSLAECLDDRLGPRGCPGDDGMRPMWAKRPTRGDRRKEVGVDQGLARARTCTTADVGPRLRMAGGWELARRLGLTRTDGRSLEGRPPPSTPRELALERAEGDERVRGLPAAALTLPRSRMSCSDTLFDHAAHLDGRVLRVAVGGRHGYPSCPSARRSACGEPAIDVDAHVQGYGSGDCRG